MSVGFAVYLSKRSTICIPAGQQSRMLSRKRAKHMTAVSRVFLAFNIGLESTMYVVMASMRHMDESKPRVTSVKKEIKLQNCGSGRDDTFTGTSNIVARYPR